MRMSLRVSRSRNLVWIISNQRELAFSPEGAMELLEALKQVLEHGRQVYMNAEYQAILSAYAAPAKKRPTQTNTLTLDDLDL